MKSLQNPEINEPKITSLGNLDRKLITQMKEKDQLTERIIGCCFKVHRELGPGYNEKIYYNALKLFFNNEGLRYEREKAFDVFFSSKKVGSFRANLVVQDEVIVEIKSIPGNIPIFFRHQLISYLKASGIRTGLLVNFGNKT